MASDATQEQNDSTKGLNALVPDLPEFTIAEKKYKMSRLGLNHAMQALRIFAAASGGIMKLNLSNTNNNPTTIALAILSALPYAENHVKDLIASSLKKVNADGSLSPVSKLELENPDLFPLDTIIDIIEGLGVHPDLKAFLKNIERLQKSPIWEEIQARAPKPQTPPSNSSGN